MNRRQALTGAVAAAAGIGASAVGAEEGNVRLPQIDEMTNVCAHEHWGSLPSIGFHGEGFRADNVAGAGSDDVTLFDLLFCPYLHGFLAQGGFDTHGLASAGGHSDIMAMAREEPEKVIAAALPHLRSQRTTGAVTCLTLGVRLLHEFDLDDLSPTNFEAVSDRINMRYRNIFGWYRQAMGMANLEGPYRAVGLSFLLERENPQAAERELSFTKPLLRIDDYLGPIHKANSRFRYTMDNLGMEPTDAATWRAFIGEIIERAAQAGCIGIKQLQAYSRDLDFQPVGDDAVDFSADEGEGLRTLQNWIVNVFCEEANARGWPFQIHVGTHNLPQSSPLPLATLMVLYPSVKFVMIHTWPYLDETAFLVKQHHNAYVDTCWLPILSHSHMEAALRTYIGYVPGHKLMLSQDATSVELAAGSSQVNRALLRKVLVEKIDDGLIEERHALDLAQWALGDNARAVHGT